MSKEEFNKLWKNSTKEQILNQYYYDYEEMIKSHNTINELEKLISLDINFENDYLSDVYVRGIRDEARDIYNKLQELKGDSSND